MTTANGKLASYSSYFVVMFFALTSLIVGTMISQEPLLVSIMVLIIVIMICSLKQPWIIVAIVLATRMPLNSVFKEIQFGEGFTRFNLTGLARVLFITFTFILIASRAVLKPGEFRKAYLFKPICLFALVMSLQVLRAPDRILSFRYFTNLIEPLCLYLLATLTVKSTRQVYIIIACYIGASLVPLVTGISEMLSGGHWLGGALVDRVVSVANHPNEFAAYLIGILLVSTSILLQTKLTRIRIVLGIVIMLGFSLLVFTFTRIAWASFSVGILVFLLYKQYQIKFIPVLLLFFGAFALAASFIPEVSQLIIIRLFLDRGSPEAHMYVNQFLWNQFLLNPVLGYGLYSAPILLESVLRLWTTPHNDYIGFLVETGIVGFVSYLILLTSAFSLLLRVVRSNDQFTRGLQSAAVAIFVAFWIFGLTDAAATYLGLYVWSIIGLAEVQSRVQKETELNGNTPILKYGVSNW